VWDDAWGTCLSLGGSTIDCERSPTAAGLDTGIASGVTKQTGSADTGSDADAQKIPITPAVAGQLRDGRYQLVAITNPYRALAEAGGAAGSVACRDFQFSISTAAGMEGILTATQVPDVPATCELPTTMPAPVSLGGRDPMAGSLVLSATCPFVPPNGHCWVTPPLTGDHRAARTNATGTPTPTAYTTVPQHSPLGPASLAAVTPIAAPAGASTTKASTVGGQSSSTRRVMTASRARAYTRTALRRAFGRGLSALRVSCRVATSVRSTCTVSWRKAGASYRGKLYVRYRTVRSRLRWQYRVDVTKRKDGRAQHIRHDYRTGGTF
jgi:hypothetical protein